MITPRASFFTALVEQPSEGKQKRPRVDEELKKYWQDMEDRTAALIAGEIGSVHTHIRQTEARLSAKIDDINTRFDMHAGLLQTGAR